MTEFAAAVSYVSCVVLATTCCSNTRHDTTLPCPAAAAAAAPSPPWSAGATLDADQLKKVSGLAALQAQLAALEL